MDDITIEKLRMESVQLAKDFICDGQIFSPDWTGGELITLADKIYRYIRYGDKKLSDESKPD